MKEEKMLEYVTKDGKKMYAQADSGPVGDGYYFNPANRYMGLAPDCVGDGPSADDSVRVARLGAAGFRKCHANATKCSLTAFSGDTKAFYHGRI